MCMYFYINVINKRLPCSEGKKLWRLVIGILLSLNVPVKAILPYHSFINPVLKNILFSYLYLKSGCVLNNFYYYYYN